MPIPQGRHPFVIASSQKKYGLPSINSFQGTHLKQLNV